MKMGGGAAFPERVGTQSCSGSYRRSELHADHQWLLLGLRPLCLAI
jgi:hypothetical protein